MTRAHELRMQSQGMSVLPALGATALILVVAASLVLALHPSAGHELAKLYTALRATGQLSAWGDAVLRASAAAACASATIYTLVAFGRGVQSAPFLWLSPVLLGFGMAVMMRMRVTPPLPMPELAFYVLSALLLLGGGAFLQRRGLSGAIAGSLLMLLPLFTLAAGYTQRAGDVSRALGTLSAGAALHAFVLLVMSMGLSFIAVSTRSEVSPARNVGRRRYGRHAEGEALEEALEQARISEIRVQAAEERVSIAQQQLSMQAAELESALAIQEDLKAVTPRRIGMRLMISAAVMLAVFGAFMAAFLGLYQPLQVKAARAQALATHLESERQSLAAGFDKERSALLADMQQARNVALEAEANVEKLQATIAAVAVAPAVEVPAVEAPSVAAPAVASSAVAETVAKPAAKAKRSNKRAARSARVTAAKAAKAEAAATRATERSQRPAPARASRNNDAEMNDDPIAGLDL